MGGLPLSQWRQGRDRLGGGRWEGRMGGEEGEEIVIGM